MFLFGFGLWFTAIYITCIVYAVGLGSSVFRRVVVAEHLAILYDKVVFQLRSPGSGDLHSYLVLRTLDNGNNQREHSVN